ncbi:hypothetical protein ACFPN7_24125 [Amycolatopsis halotolerans]|uniref:hypothetical protein n=1 Tax=Amycolatopsis halotolerans TaxID=330083 RepID=UPI00360EF3F8
MPADAAGRSDTRGRSLRDDLFVSRAMLPVSTILSPGLSASPPNLSPEDAVEETAAVATVAGVIPTRAATS